MARRMEHAEHMLRDDAVADAAKHAEPEPPRKTRADSLSEVRGRCASANKALGSTQLNSEKGDEQNMALESQDDLDVKVPPTAPLLPLPQPLAMDRQESHATTAKASLVQHNNDTSDLSVSSSSTRQPIDFLSLPAEIRNAIYGESIVSSSVCFYQRNGRRHVMKDDRILFPPLCRTNRQVRNEMLALFYGNSDCHVTLWPTSLLRGGPDLSWLGPPDSSQIRMYGGVRITCERFEVHLEQKDEGTKVELVDLILRFPGSDKEVVTAQLKEALSWISSVSLAATGPGKKAVGPGLTPRLLKHLIRFMLYAMVKARETVVHGLDSTAARHTAKDFVSRYVKLKDGQRAVARDMLRLNYTI